LPAAAISQLRQLTVITQRNQGNAAALKHRAGIRARVPGLGPSGSAGKTSAVATPDFVDPNAQEILGQSQNNNHQHHHEHQPAELITV
jgi:hypothetical protein